jgi:hypothetical protein
MAVRPDAPPKAVLDTLTDALDRALDDDTVRKRLSDLGCESRPIATPFVATCVGMVNATSSAAGLVGKAAPTYRRLRRRKVVRRVKSLLSDASNL